MGEFEKTAVSAARLGGKILRKYFEHLKYARKKSSRDFVTNADIECERALISLIHKNFPDHSIYSEEAGKLYSHAHKSEYLWLIDPLDGTNNYAFGIPVYGISIALAHRNKVILGVIHYPETNDILVAKKGEGAYINNKKMHVTSRTKLSDSLVLLDSKLGYMSRTGKLPALLRVGKKSLWVGMTGAAVYNFGYVALGKADATIEFNLKKVDFPAGALLVEEAGGKVSDTDGSPWNMNTKNFLASNGKVHKKMLAILRR